MAEQINLTIPYTADPRVTRYWKIERDVFLRSARQYVIHLRGEGGLEYQKIVRGSNAVLLWNQTNRPNPGKSKHRILLEWLINQGELSGTISGGPD